MNDDWPLQQTHDGAFYENYIELSCSDDEGYLKIDFQKKSVPIFKNDPY